MALQTQPSRFAVLPDDVAEPVAKKEKAKKPTNVKKTDNSKGKVDTSKKKANGPKGKSLKSLAFGGTGDGKKNKSNSNQPAQAANGHSSNANNQMQPSPLRNGANRTSEQWEEFLKRDAELVTDVYETDLEAALIQSQVDYQNEMARRAGSSSNSKSKGKKKAITVPLNEFNKILLDGPKSSVPPNPYVDESDEKLIERFRLEAKLQLEREKEMAIQKEILAKRQSEGVYKHPHSRDRETRERAPEEVDEKTKIIDNLRAENELLKSEVESYKSRLKKVHDIFQSAQELKDKAKLIYQVETLTKHQEDLNEQIQELHSQLEQEKSKSHAAIDQCRRLMEQQSRRRTNTEASN